MSKSRSGYEIKTINTVRFFTKYSIGGPTLIGIKEGIIRPLPLLRVFVLPAPDLAGSQKYKNKCFIPPLVISVDSLPLRGRVIS